ncbi:hypothetical protein P7L53_13140 [Thermoleptolyngbya sichuanensis XZ-Cy5]|nr:hypothetical protein [Thermoleptolyngbya sichuanensis]MDG2617184.1 hypothetical protein [Thermoleptolyngbya sichuanensis XZ-Cy5]
MTFREFRGCCFAERRLRNRAIALIWQHRHLWAIALIWQHRHL